MAIALAAGPEIFAAMEMTALLELLGPILFLTAFAAGAKLVAWSIWRAICNVAPHLNIMHSGAPATVKAQTLIYVAAHTAYWMILVLVLALATADWGHRLIHLAA